MARKKPIAEEPVPAFRVVAKQSVSLVFPNARRGYSGERLDFHKTLTREEARALADALAIEANKLNA